MVDEAPPSQEAELVRLEHGAIRFFARPKVERGSVASFADVQAFYFVLVPARGGPVRRVRVGRKRMPHRGRRDRQWAFVERVGEDLDDVLGGIGPETYFTKTKGLRQQAGASEVARGRYEILEHGAHAHLAYDLDDENTTAELGAELGLEAHASLIAAVFNPERKAPFRRTEPRDDGPFSEPSIFPPELADKFGDRRFAPLEPDFLDVEGAELLLVGSRERDPVEGGPEAPDRPDR